MPHIVEPWTRYDESLQWQIHRAYYQQRGGGAWSEFEIPYMATSNIAQVRRYVKVLEALVAERGPADGPVYVLEVGAGSGHFAANFMRALEELGPHLEGRVAERVRYVASDYSEKSLRDLVASPHCRVHAAAGRITPARFDLFNPQSLATIDGAPFELPDGASFALVIANYVCSAIPMTPLQKRDRTWHELWLQTISTDAPPTIAEAATKPKTLEGLERHSEWRPLQRSLGDTLGPLHSGVVDVATAGLTNATVFYPRRYFDFIADIGRFARDAVFLTTDYGTVYGNVFRGNFDRPPQHYGNSLGQSVMFALFDPFAALAGFAVERSMGEFDNVHVSAVVRGKLGPRLRHAIDAGRLFGAHQGDHLLDFATSARIAAERNDYLSAMRFWNACVHIDDKSARYRYELADCALSDLRAELALKQLLIGQQLDALKVYDWDFMLGRAYYLCGRLSEAVAAYERSLMEGAHPQTFLNLGAIHRQEGRLAEAARCFREAVALDPKEQRGWNALAEIEAKIRSAPTLTGP